MDPDRPMELFILDGIAPFFRGCRKKRINWSKIPFESLERDGRVDRDRFDEIRPYFDRFVDHAKEAGANALSLDDLAHLFPHEAHPDALRERVAAYREEFGRLFDVAGRAGLHVFLTSDVLSLTPELERRIGDDDGRAIDLLAAACTRILDDYPQVAGVILRIGECDARDVNDAFKSRLRIRTPAQARRWLRRLLPIFAERGRRLVVRTWTVGAYPIGDLIWNRDTFAATFDGIESDALVISMKYGESDFFRYLPLNRHFFRGPHQKIIELQARREYEGCGEYPSFIGVDYERYRRDLHGARNVIGCMVWCQTGGWTRFRRLTYVGRPKVWNEINTFVTLRIFRDGWSAEEAVREYHRRFLSSDTSADDLLELLLLSDRIVKELLYIDDYARQKLFFRRTRLPTLLSVLWDRVLVNHPMRKVLRCFVADGEAKVRQGWEAWREIDRMHELAVRLGLPAKDIERMRDAFRLLAKAREYYFRPYDLSTVQELEAMEVDYKQRHRRRHRYAIKLDFKRAGVARSTLRGILYIALRRRRGYRLIDRVVTVELLAWLHPLVKVANRRLFPEAVRDEAMGVDTLFK